MVAAITGLTTWALWPDAPRQREYIDAKACLLTDEKGILGEPAKTTWSAMKDASATTLVRAQYLPITTDDAEPYLNTLVLSHCGLIVAAGSTPVGTVTGNAGKHLDVQFVTVNGGTEAKNVRVIDTSALESLREEFEDLADAAS